jgi:hypothetical protein
MTPKDRAKDLISKFGKEVALKVIYEIIDALEKYDELTEQYLKDEFGLEYFSVELQNMDNDFRYWDNVEIEIKEN